MSSQQDITGLEELIDHIGGAAGVEGRVSLGSILDAVGRRSFGPLLLVAGLITLAPVIGDIPGMPTTMGVLVLLTAIQMLFRRDHIWLPDWLLRREVTQDKLSRGLEWLRRPARFFDRWTRPRLTFFVRNGGIRGIAVACLAIAAVMPAMEVVPFSANAAGGALTAFGVALIARDGLLELIALMSEIGTIGVVIYHLL